MLTLEPPRERLADDVAHAASAHKARTLAGRTQRAITPRAVVLVRGVLMSATANVSGPLHAITIGQPRRATAWATKTGFSAPRSKVASCSKPASSAHLQD